MNSSLILATIGMAAALDVHVSTHATPLLTFLTLRLLTFLPLKLFIPNLTCLLFLLSTITVTPRSAPRPSRQ